MKKLYEDAKQMLVRQRQLATSLEPISYYADVVGKAGELDAFYARLLRVQGAGTWRFPALELLHRRGRRATEEGKHKTALDLYGELQQAGGGARIPELLQLDAADSLAAIGNRVRAEQVWRRVVGTARPGSLESSIARARLGLPGGRQELEKWDATLAEAAWGGEQRRRTQWSLKALSGR